jgi:hypothetical protein
MSTYHDLVERYPLTHHAPAPITRVSECCSGCVGCSDEVGAFTRASVSEWLDRPGVYDIPNKWILLGTIGLFTIGLGVYASRR